MVVRAEFVLTTVLLLVALSSCCSLAYSTPTRIESAFNRILGRVLMAMFASRRGLMFQSPLPRRIGHVVCAGSEKQMVRPHAGWHIAPMANAQSCLDGAVGQRPGESMSVDRIDSPAGGELAIAEEVLARCPQPALSGFVHLRPEAYRRIYARPAPIRARVGAKRPRILLSRQLSRCPEQIAAARSACQFDSLNGSRHDLQFIAFERATCAYEFFRGQVSEQQCRQVASRMKAVADAAGVTVGYGNGLPAETGTTSDTQ